MAQELALKSYYQSTRDSNLIDINLATKFALEFFLSTLLFKGDLSRVVYSKEDIAFRRRVETLGNGDVRDNVYNYISLDLPFAVYSQTGPYEEDDRGATQNAGQIVLGQIQPESGIIVKAAAVKTKYNATLFFSRRDDVNIASQLLYWEKTPKFPVYYIVQYTINGYPIDIPVFMTLESFDSNTEYEEKTWLQQSKIFPIKCEFTIRSYQTLIEHIDNTIKLPIRFSGLYGYNDEEIYFTQKTCLIWSDQKWTPSEYEKLMEKIVEVGPSGIVTVSKKDPYLYPPGLPYDPNNNKKIDDLQGETWPSVAETAKLNLDIGLENYGKLTQVEVNETVADAVVGYFQEDRDCVLDEFHQVNENTTENSIEIEWKIKEADKPFFKNIIIYVPGLIRTQIDDIHTTTFTLSGLYPGSKYDCTLIITSKDFNKLTYKLKLLTKGTPVMPGKLMDKLVGKQFTFTGNEVQ
jgi:hypothetical protein